jgi:hypothetical protein
MKYQEYMASATQSAANEAFKYAKAVTADKVEWSPLDAGRSVLDQAREMAKCPDWACQLLTTGSDDWSEEQVAAQKEEMGQWKTVEQCEAACNEKLKKLFVVFSEIPDSRLEEKKWLPYDGGRDFTVMEMMDYPRWNFNYHLGQIGYIQTLYGDKGMY